MLRDDEHEKYVRKIPSHYFYKQYRWSLPAIIPICPNQSARIVVNITVSLIIFKAVKVKKRRKVNNDTD
jgi:hypothetical protein